MNLLFKFSQAVPSAWRNNGSKWDNEVDRANLQAEVEQLKSEINRIADSANFKLRETEKLMPPMVTVTLPPATAPLVDSFSWLRS